MGGRAPLELAVVVDLAVDREHQVPVGDRQRLRAVQDVDDGEPLVRQHARVGYIPLQSGPRWRSNRAAFSAMSRADGEAAAQIEEAEDSTHAPDNSAGGTRTSERPRILG